MIYVGGVSISTPKGGSSMVDTLMVHPLLVSAARAFRAIPEKKFSITSEETIPTRCRLVYIFQREYATVHPSSVDLIGTDEATTCVCLVIRNRRNGMTSVAHLDSPKIVEMGVIQMLSQFDPNDCAEFDVHLLGGFEDSSHKMAYHSSEISGHSEKDGHSYPLCAKIIEVLGKSEKEFHLQTFFVLQNNTRWDGEGNSYPLFNGILVETSSGSVSPSSFDQSMRGPDEIVRRIRVSLSYDDPNWTGKLLETYDTLHAQFKIAPCIWTVRQVHFAMTLKHLSDSEVLLHCSSSPFAEGPDFVDNLRRGWEYLIQLPHWSETFPNKQPRIFQFSRCGWKSSKALEVEYEAYGDLNILENPELGWFLPSQQGLFPDHLGGSSVTIH